MYLYNEIKIFLNNLSNKGLFYAIRMKIWNKQKDIMLFDASNKYYNFDKKLIIQNILKKDYFHLKCKAVLLIVLTFFMLLYRFFNTANNQTIVQWIIVIAFSIILILVSYIKYIYVNQIKIYTNFFYFFMYGLLFDILICFLIELYFIDYVVGEISTNCSIITFFFVWFVPLPLLISHHCLRANHHMIEENRPHITTLCVLSTVCFTFLNYIYINDKKEQELFIILILIFSLIDAIVGSILAKNKKWLEKSNYSMDLSKEVQDRLVKKEMFTYIMSSSLWHDISWIEKSTLCMLQNKSLKEFYNYYIYLTEKNSS